MVSDTQDNSGRHDKNINNPATDNYNNTSPERMKILFGLHGCTWYPLPTSTNLFYASRRTSNAPEFFFVVVDAVFSLVKKNRFRKIEQVVPGIIFFYGYLKRNTGEIQFRNNKRKKSVDGSSEAGTEMLPEHVFFTKFEIIVNRINYLLLLPLSVSFGSSGMRSREVDESLTCATNNINNNNHNNNMKQQQQIIEEHISRRKIGKKNRNVNSQI
eukprot:gene3953-2816_t